VVAFVVVSCGCHSLVPAVVEPDGLGDHVDVVEMAVGYAAVHGFGGRGDYCGLIRVYAVYFYLHNLFRNIDIRGEKCWCG